MTTQIVYALQTETEVPDYITTWTQGLDYDRLGTPMDRLIVIGARLAALKKSFRAADMSDQALVETAALLEQDLIAWSDDTSTEGSACSFRTFRETDASNSWNGWRHEYPRLLVYHYWNCWRTMRILLTWMQEALWRRSWPTLVQSMGGLVDPNYYKGIRNGVVADLCK